MKNQEFAILTLRHKKEPGLELPIPYFVTIDDQPVCMLRRGEVHIKVLAGHHTLKVKTGFIFGRRELMVSGARELDIRPGRVQEFEFRSHERVWNILFDIDLLLWIAEFFVTPPEPWDLVYKIVSDGFFIVWLIRLFVIRKRYFRLKMTREGVIRKPLQ